MTDPFTVLFDKLWEVVDSDSDLQQLVNEGGKIKFVRDVDIYGFDPRNRQVNQPELSLLPDLFEANIGATNNSSEIIRSFNWSIRTPSKMLNKELFPIEWSLYKAMCVYAPEIRTVTYANEKFVHKINVISGSNFTPEIDMIQANPTLIGWRTIWTMQFEMSFSKNQLQEFMF